MSVKLFIFEENPRLLKGNLQVIACAGAGKTDNAL
jgi:superfamily I DNA/RNA helicase